MSLIEGKERSSPEYLKELEERYSKLKILNQANEEEFAKLQQKFTDIAGSSTASAPMETGDNARKEGNYDILSALKGIDTGMATLAAKFAQLEIKQKDLSTGGAVEASTGTMSGITTPASACCEVSNHVSKLRHKGRQFRPEIYILSKKLAVPIDEVELKLNDRDKIDFTDLTYGFIKVLVHLLNSKSSMLDSYIKHMEHVFTMLHSRRFHLRGAIDYNMNIVDEIVQGTKPDFSVDIILSELSFAPAKLLFSEEKYQKSSEFTRPWNRRRGRGSDNRSQGRSGSDTWGDKPDKNIQVPDDFPKELCYYFNYYSCDNKCGRDHRCRKCNGRHPSKGCWERK